MSSDRPRLAVRLTNDAFRQLRGGHPWIFDRAIVSVSPGGEPGDLAVIFDSKRRFAAIGLWDPTSPIRVRILHVGKPRTIDASFWSDRVAEALARRSSLVDQDAAQATTTGWRVIHGENDQLPGVVADRYDNVLVVKIYSAAWESHLGEIVDALCEGLSSAGCPVDTVVVRRSRAVAQTMGLPASGQRFLGNLPGEPVRFQENGLTMQADVVEGQKTGHFLDQRDNRHRIAALSLGRDVLDVFSCTGGFSLHAAAAGARSATSIDQSPHALAFAASNFALNPLETSSCRHALRQGDAFEEMARLKATGTTFDVVVVDPPSFASKQSDVERALRSYERLAEAAVKLTRPGGTLFQASCSSRIDAAQLLDAVQAGAQAAGRALSITGEFGHAVDHPIGFVHGGYLKAVQATVR